MHNKIPIKEIGTVLQTDGDGTIVSQSSANKIVEPWKSAINSVVGACQKILADNLHSVYVRGSASRGGAIEGVSDLDMVIVTHRGLTGEERTALDQGRQMLELKFPFCVDIEINRHVLSELISGRDKGFALLKIYSACVWGEDIIPQLPGVKPGREVAMHAAGFKRRIDERLGWFESGEKEFTPARCTWLMKRLLRVGGELIMEREQVFVRDLYPCYALFSRYYPDKDAEMRQVLEYALNPTDELSEVKVLVVDMSEFLEGEASRVFRN